MLGDEHPDTLISLNNLAFAYGDIGDFEKSLELFENLYEINCRLYGEDSQNALDIAAEIEEIRDEISGSDK